MKSFPIDGLDFDEIKSNFIEFLKQDAAYKDYNFDASGISSLINIFAYNAHYIGYYVKMLLNESFIDSATQRETLLSKAKLNGYIPKGVRSARARVILTCDADISQDPEKKSVIIPRGSYFSGANTNNDSRTFYVIDDVICYNREEYNGPNNVRFVRYTSPEFTVYEGVMKKWRFVVNSSEINQRFIIKDATVDIDTLRIDVYNDSNSTEKTEFKLASNLFDLQPDSKVFYISTNEDGYYEIFFGNDQFGAKLGNGNMIEASYLSSKGESGNGCKTMTYVQPPQSIYTRNTTAFFSIFSTNVTEVSNGGMDEETIDDLRFNIPNHYRRQNRIVTESDYRSILLNEFRNIDSINVWGGEKNYTREYGTVFICIKPKYGLTLSGYAREEIEQILTKYGVVGIQQKIVDPEYLKLDINLFVKYNSSVTYKSIGEIESLVYDMAVSYGKEKLDKFDAGLSEVDFLDYIRQSEPSITRIYSTKTMSKDVTIIYRASTEHIVIFGNKIVQGSLKSSVFTYGMNKCSISDDGSGSLWVMSNGDKLINKPIGTIDYENGIVKFILDIDIISDTDYNKTRGLIEFTANPALNDIDTYLNNIIIFNNVNVNVTYA
jgi:hypothetical protein